MQTYKERNQKRIIERMKASLYVLGIMALLGFLMDVASMIGNWNPILFFLPVFLLGWLFLFVASLFKFAYDKSKAQSNSKDETQGENKP